MKKKVFIAMLALMFLYSCEKKDKDYNINYRLFKLKESEVFSDDETERVDAFSDDGKQSEESWLMVCPDCGEIVKFNNLKDYNSLAHVCQSEKAKARRRFDAIEKRLDNLEQFEYEIKKDNILDNILLEREIQKALEE